MQIGLAASYGQNRCGRARDGSKSFELRTQLHLENRGIRPREGHDDHAPV